MSAITSTLRRFAGRAVAVRRIAAVAVIAVATTAATACGSDSKGDSTGPESITGTYALQKAGGQSLPTAIYEGQIDLGDGEVMDVIISVGSGNLKLNGDGSFTGSLALEIETESGVESATLPVSGEYVRNGGSITFSSDDPEDPEFSATLDGDTISASIDIFGTGESISFQFSK